MAALKPGQLVLVTGASGHIGAHVAEECLAAGLRVRATARTPEKAAKLEKVFAEKYGKDKIETIIVEDFVKDGAYDEAIKGVHGVAHVASVLNFSDKWEEVVDPSVKGALVALEAAAKEPGLTRFVITSSSCALGMPSLTTAQTWDEKTWNEGSLEKAKKTPNAWDVYAASKVLAERAGWEFVAKNKPNFAFTSINPNANFGLSHPASTTLSTNGWILSVAKGDTTGMEPVTSQYFVNVTDVARLHVAALVRDDVKNERVLGFTQKFTWKDILDTVKKVDPSAPDAKPIYSQEWLTSQDKTTVDASRMVEILGGKAHVADLELSVKQALGKAPVHAAA